MGMHTKLPNLTDLPHDLKIVQTYARIQHAFPGSQTPAVVVVKAPNVEAPAIQHAYALFRQRALATHQFYAPFTVSVNPDHTVARIDFAIAGNGDNAASLAALHTLRDKVIPPIARTLPGVEVAVTGVTAGTYDFNHQMRSRLPVGVPLRAGARLHPAAAHVPVDRDRRHGGRAEPAVRRRRLRDPRRGLPVRLAVRRLRLPDERRDRELAAAVPVRRALRALDGLPRLHPEPRQGAARRQVPRPTMRSGSGSRGRPAPSRARRSSWSPSSGCSQP